MRLPRRTVLAAAVAAGTLAQLPAYAEDSPIDGSTLPTFGPACLTAAVVASAVHDGRVYVISRGIVPPRLTELDLTTRKVTRTVELPVGEGGWAITVAAGKIYVGLYPVPDVYCFDPADGSLIRVGSLAGADGFVWDLTTAPDGQVFAVSYPNGTVWQIDPATNALTKLGAPVAGAQYARYVGAAGDHVYAGIYTPSQLVDYDRTTSTFRDLTPESIRGQKFGPFAATADRLYVGSDGALTTMALDGTDVRTLPLPAGETGIDTLTVGPDGTAYVTTRGSGTVWSSDGTKFTAIATPAPQDEHRKIEFLDEKTLLGSTGSGVLWWLDVTTGSFELLDLLDAGFTAAADKPQSIVLGDPNLYVGGHWVITEHAGDETRRFRVAGEAKTLTWIRGELYSALYPSTEIVRVNPRSGDVHSFGVIGHSQLRPWQAAYDEATKLLAVATAPGTGKLTGALTLLDVRTGELDVHYGVLPDQSVMTVAIADGVAYLGGDVVGGGGVTATRASAAIAAFDLRRRELLWTVEPFAGERSIQSVAVHNGILYGVLKRTSGGWFTYDPRTGTAIRGANKLSGYGQIHTDRTGVYCETNFGGNLYQLGPDLTEAKLLVGKLGDGWFTVPQLTPVRGARQTVWGLADRDLVQLPLP
ncbi:PQQ-binding-like beta-propeller repeat protein [Kribbella sp. NPDC004875]|uniref:outer membrane protein assembly factor BamB family protein n=1 Tax=Kribbella sp. NPDC004875 TaxID=3364107 RepID=UPI003690C13D